MLRGFLLGFVLALFPVIILFKVFKNKFLGIEHLYLKGAMMGFLVWGTSMSLMMLDVQTGAIGYVQTDSGMALMSLLLSSSHGFITCGIAVAFVFENFEALMKKAAEKSAASKGKKK